VIKDINTLNKQQYFHNMNENKTLHTELSLCKIETFAIPTCIQQPHWWFPYTTYIYAIHIRRTLQVLLSTCLWIATNAPSWVGKQVHEDLGSLFFTDHIRPLWDSTQKLADLGNPLVTQLGRYQRWPNLKPHPLKQGDWEWLALPNCKGGHVD